MPGFALSYAVAGFVLDKWSRTKPGGSPGARTRRRQRFVVEAGDRRPSTTSWRRGEAAPAGREQPGTTGL